jgi:ribosomal protein L37E/uncharacterized membrane protein
MIICPKCGHKNETPHASDCPKCGVIYEKFRQMQQQRKAEQKLNNEFESVMMTNTDTSGFVYDDFESVKDKDSYASISNLSFYFICIGIILIAFWIYDLKFIWSVLSAYANFMKTSDKIFIVLAMAVFTSIPIALYFAVGAGLKLGKDIANNTRATRNYIRDIAQKTK